MTEKKRTRIQIRNEEKIISAAQQVFATYGFHGATMEKVAALTDMSQPNLHHYFKTKAELYIAVLDQTLDIWMKPIAGLDPDGDPALELRNYIAQKMEMARKYPVASRVFANEMLQGAPILEPHLKTRVKEKVEEWATVVRHWTAAGKIKNIDPYHLIFMIWASTQHYSDFAPQIRAVMGVSRLTKAQFSAAEASIIDIIIGGLAPHSAAKIKNT